MRTMRTYTFQSGWTLFFSLLFWLLGVLFLMAFSNVSWWIALIGIIISSVEIKVERTRTFW